MEYFGLGVRVVVLCEVHMQIEKMKSKSSISLSNVSFWNKEIK